MKKVIYVLTVLLVIGILAGCNSTDVPTVPETDSNTADTSVATDIGKTAAAEVGSNSAQITEKAPETAAESNTASGIGGVFNCYRAKYCFEYGTIPFELEDNGVLAPGEIKQWLITERGFSETLNSVGADKSDILLGIIEYFNIPKEKFPVDKFLTQERVDALYSKDRSKMKLLSHRMQYTKTARYTLPNGSTLTLSKKSTLSESPWKTLRRKLKPIGI